MAKNTPKYSFETIDEVLSDIKQSKGLTSSVKAPGLGSSKSVLPASNINSVLSYGGGNPNKALRVAEYNVPMTSVYDRLSDGTYAAKFENYLGAEGNENRLALQQSGWEQAGKGLLKNTLKVGSYAFDSVIGTAYGLTKALGSGQLKDLYDNELTNSLDDMNKKLDYALPNYYSDEQKSMSLLRSLGTVNFWANDVAGGLAFVGGALLPQIAIGIATGGASAPGLAATVGKFGAKLALKAGKEVVEETAKAALKKGLKSSLDDGLKAIGSTSQKIGSVTGYTKGKNVIKSYQQGILGNKLGTFTNTTGFLARSAGFEAGMEARQAMKESVDNYYQQFQQQNGRMPNFEESQSFMNDAVKASNKVFGANMAILTLSNAVMYGKKILPESTSNWVSKTIGGKVNNIIGLGTKSSVVDGKLAYTMLGANRAQKIAGKAYKTLSKPLVEGIYEEGLQGVASKTMKNYIDAKYDKNNLDGYSFWSSLNDSFAEQYGTNEGWKEMTIGMIIGFAGGGMTPGAIKNKYAFSGFGKNSYSSRRSEIESNLKRANDGIELLSSLNRTSAAVAKEAAMKSGNKSDFTGAEDSLSHYNFIRSQESINSYSQMKNDYNVVIDNLQLEDESVSAIENAGLNIDSYRTKLKDDFSKSLSNYQFAKKAVESLGLNSKLKDTPGNIAEISDALMFGLMTGKDSLENAKNIGSQIDSIIGTQGVYNHLNFYNNLEQEEKDQFLELRDKQENLKQLQDAAARVSQKIGKINSTGQMTPELVENRRKRLSEQAVSIQDSIVSTNQRIDQLKDILSTNFKNSKYNLTSEEIGGFETVEDVVAAVENIDKIDNITKSFDKAGKRQESDTLKYLVQQFKISSDSHREMINNYRKMMDTNFFSSKEGKGFLNSVLGSKFTMSDDFKNLIKENDSIVDNSLGLNGIRDYETVQKKLEEVITDNDQLSDREKFRLESLIRLSLSKGAYEKAVEDLQSTSKQMQTRMTTSTTELATKPEDLRRINLTAEGLNNINIIDKAISEITKELDYIINYSTKNVEKIRKLEEEIENLKQQREDIIENSKNKQSAPETTTTTVSTEDIEAKKADIEKRRQEELNNRRITNTNNDGKWDVAADYLLTGGTGTVLSTDYLLLGIAGVFDKATGLIDDIRNRYAQELAESMQVDVKDFIGTELYNRVINDIKSAINEVYSNTKEANDILEQILKNPTGASNRIGNEISGKISKLTEDQNRIVNSKYDAELAALEGNTTTTTTTTDVEPVQQNDPFSAPEQTVSAEQEEIQNNIVSLEEELDNLNQQRDEVVDLIDKQNQAPKFIPEQVERFKQKWNYWKSEDLTGEDEKNYFRWLQSDEGVKWINEQYPTESMHQDLRNLFQVMSFRKFAAAVRKNLSPFFSEQSAIKDAGIKMKFEEWAGYQIGDGLLEYTKDGYNKFINSLDNATLEKAGIERPNVSTETTEPNLNANTVNQQVEDYTSRKEEIEKNILDLENQINDLKSSLSSIKNKDTEVSTEPIVENLTQQEDLENKPETGLSTIDKKGLIVSQEQEGIEKNIADLEKQLDELKRPFKIIESPEYIRYSELASIAEKENLTDAEKDELDELRSDIDQWTLITGVVVDGFRLSDLILQKSVLENTEIEKIKDIEIPSSEDTLDSETFADVTTRANYSFGLVYDKVFASKSGDLITVHNINAKSLEEILGKEFMTDNEIVLEKDPTGKDNVVLTQASVDSINKNSNIRIRNTERNMLTNYSVVLERVVGLDGKVTYKPLKSAFSEEFNNGEGHDVQAVFGAQIGDELEITTDLDNVYNIQLINEYREALNEYGSKPQQSEQDRIELEKAYNRFVSKLNMQAKIGGKVVSTMKGLNKTVQDKNSDNIYVAFRNNIFSNPEQFKAILSGSGEYTVKVTNPAGELVKPKVTVSQLLMGHPNYNYVETEDGILATEFKQLSDVEAKEVVDVGYVVGTKTFTRDNQTVNTMFLKKMMNKKSANKIPFIVLNVGGKRVAYPVKVASFGEAEISEFESVYNNKSADPVTKSNALNRILAKNGIDIKQPGNSFIGFFNDNLNDKFFQEKLAQLKNVNYFYNVDEWIDLNIDLNDIVKTQLSVDIDVLNPFHSPKLSFSYAGLDMKDFVRPKKGKTKGKAASKSKNVEVNLADLFNKKNCQ